MYLICLHLFDNNEFIDIPYFWNYTYVPIIRFAGEKKHLLTTYLRQPEVEKLNILTMNNKDLKKGNQSQDTHIKFPNQLILIEQHFEPVQMFVGLFCPLFNL